MGTDLDSARNADKIQVKIGKQRRKSRGKSENNDVKLKNRVLSNHPYAARIASETSTSVPGEGNYYRITNNTTQEIFGILM